MRTVFAISADQHRRGENSVNVTMQDRPADTGVVSFAEFTVTDNSDRVRSSGTTVHSSAVHAIKPSRDVGHDRFFVVCGSVLMRPNDQGNWAAARDLQFVTRLDGGSS